MKLHNLWFIHRFKEIVSMCVCMSLERSSSKHKTSFLLLTYSSRIAIADVCLCLSVYVCIIIRNKNTVSATITMLASHFQRASRTLWLPNGKNITNVINTRAYYLYLQYGLSEYFLFSVGVFFFVQCTQCGHHHKSNGTSSSSAIY